jgi:hypothetical protein
MDMKAAVAASNSIVLLPRLSHGALHPQITSCGILSLPRSTLQTVSMAERKQSLPGNVVRASSGQDYESGSGGGRSIVDANMPFLRKRINKMKLQEGTKIFRFPPELESEWMEWEKELYPTYHSKICQSMGLLHNYLIYTRPSVALAGLTAMALVVTASVILVLVTSVNSIYLARLGA